MRRGPISRKRRHRMLSGEANFQSEVKRRAQYGQSKYIPCSASTNPTGLNNGLIASDISYRRCHQLCHRGWGKSHRHNADHRGQTSASSDSCSTNKTFTFWFIAGVHTRCCKLSCAIADCAGSSSHPGAMSTFARLTRTISRIAST